MTNELGQQSQELSGKTDKLEAEIKRLQELAATTHNLVAEIERLQELADYRLKLLTKMPDQWVGLTDEEIAQAVGSPIDEVYLSDFRKVEAKLKEKNT